MILSPLADEIEVQSCLSDLSNDRTQGQGEESGLSAGLAPEPVLAIMLSSLHNKLLNVGQQIDISVLSFSNQFTFLMFAWGGRGLVFHFWTFLFGLFLHYANVLCCNFEFLFPQFENQKLTMLEAGCGVGNCLFPLLEEDPNIFAYACDFSPRAVEYVKVGAPSTYSVTFVFLDLFNLPSVPIWPVPVLSLELTSCHHHKCSFPIYIHV